MYQMGFSGLTPYCAKADSALRTRGMTVSSRQALMGRVSKLFLFAWNKMENYLIHLLFVQLLFIYTKLLISLNLHLYIKKQTTHLFQTFILLYPFRIANLVMRNPKFIMFKERQQEEFQVKINRSHIWTEMRKKSNLYLKQQQAQHYDKITKVETNILNKLALVKKSKRYIECKHLQNITHCEQYDPSVNYYDKFWKTFLINQLSAKRIQQLNQYMQDLTKKIGEVEGLLDQHEEIKRGSSKRRQRRSAGKIEKQSHCPYPHCQKLYGSEISLNLHIKLKHNGGNKKDREKAAELIWQARQNGKPIPQFFIDLPPGFVEYYGELTHRIAKMYHQHNHH